MLFQFYEQFDDDEIGALDNTELEGFIRPDSARLEEIIKDYFIQKEKEWVRFISPTVGTLSAITWCRFLTSQLTKSVSRWAADCWGPTIWVLKNFMSWRRRSKMRRRRKKRWKPLLWQLQKISGTVKPSSVSSVTVLDLRVICCLFSNHSKVHTLCIKSQICSYAKVLLMVLNAASRGWAMLGYFKYWLWEHPQKSYIGRALNVPKFSETSRLNRSKSGADVSPLEKDLILSVISCLGGFILLTCSCCISSHVFILN